MAGILDTQNKAWAEDKSKFGYKMLQKMGWSEGKGLGVKEDGVTEHVRARKKTSNAGIGATSTARDSWKVPAQVANDLNDVLSRLSAASVVGAHVPLPTGKSVQSSGDGARAKASRGFFGRRVAGKAVGTYSKDALREIFGGAPASSSDSAESTTARTDISERNEGTEVVEAGVHSSQAAKKKSEHTLLPSEVEENDEGEKRNSVEKRLRKERKDRKRRKDSKTTVADESKRTSRKLRKGREDGEEGKIRISGDGEVDGVDGKRRKRGKFDSDALGVASRGRDIRKKSSSKSKSRRQRSREC